MGVCLYFPGVELRVISGGKISACGKHKADDFAKSATNAHLHFIFI